MRFLPTWAKGCAAWSRLPICAAKRRIRRRANFRASRSAGNISRRSAADDRNQVYKTFRFSFTYRELGKSFGSTAFRDRAEPDVKSERIVGLSAPRKEGRDKVTGRARYIDDITLPDMLYGATVRSRIPRGKIKKITFGPGITWDEFVVVIREGHSREKLHRADRKRSTVPRRWNGQSSGRADSSAGPSGSTRAAESGGGGFHRVRFAAAGFHHRRERAAVRNHLGRGQYLQDVFDSEGRRGRRLGEGRLHRRRRILHRARRSSSTSKPTE